MSKLKRYFPVYLIISILAIVSCSPEPDTGPQVPTIQVADDAPLPALTATEPIVLPTPVIIESTVESEIRPTATLRPIETVEIAPEESERRYQVTFVDENDTLNVRNGPGVQNDIVFELSPAADGILVIGSGRRTNGSVWWPIRVGNDNGWANSRFLTKHIPAGDFCDSPQIETLLEDFVEAINMRDSVLLSQSTNQERGLRIRRHWWNPEVIISGEELEQLFRSNESYDWGVADGSGDPIEGTFDQIIIPLLERDLIPAQEIGCNEILSGGTAGIVQLPFPYEAVNFYSFYRPAGPDEIEFNWGTWVVGVEQVADLYFVSFLVHFEWEI